MSQPRKSRDTAHQRLVRLQHRIFRSLEAEADRLLGEAPASIQRYEREYQTDFRGARRRMRAVEKPELIQAIQAADVTLVADFHTFEQAQRTALRLMRDACAEDPARWLVGLEMIPSHFQAELDAFQEGRIPLGEFHRAIRYDEEWGFPWANYAPIFEWARQQGVRLIALNRPKELSGWSSAMLRRSKNESDLQERDRWAAGVITDLFARPDAESPAAKDWTRPKMIALYGELHIGSKHLPSELRALSREHLGKALSTVLVHQNHDGTYWSLAREEKEHETQIVRLKKSSYCVFSSTPWAKLQSLVSWAEGGWESPVLRGPSSPHQKPDDTDSAEDEDDDDSDLIETDHLSLMQTYGNAIAELLQVTPPSYESLSVRTIQEADFLDSLPGEGLFTRRELGMIRFHVNTNRRVYIPRASIAYLATPSPNTSAELSAIHLQRALSGSQAILARDPDDFFRIVLEHAFGFFGSLVLNPRRKCDLVADHVERLEQIRSGEREFHRLERESRGLALDVLGSEKRLAQGKALPLSSLEDAMSRAARVPVALIAARFVGYILGKKMHEALLAEILTTEEIREKLLTSKLAWKAGRRHFEEIYAELLKACAPAQLAPSKTDVI